MAVTACCVRTPFMKHEIRYSIKIQIRTKRCLRLLHLERRFICVCVVVSSRRDVGGRFFLCPYVTWKELMSVDFRSGGSNSRNT